MTITDEFVDDKLVISIEGRIETNTAPEFQNAVLGAFQKCSNIVLDFEEVSYISSAGLRGLLLGQKTAQSKGGSMVLTNVNDAVMEVLKMTGFKNILTIQ
ncbi:MAG: STAS domain-containing protein [Lachnospiraceae bacterium]|nr:STAS domain-containing protein [Lachnospiraceae bacterium]